MLVSLESSFPFTTAVDLKFRPESYVADWCPIAAIVQNVTGEARRELLHHSLTAGRWLPPLPMSLQAERLRPSVRDAFIACDPAVRTSGEYLPAYRRSEFEIARVVLETTPRIVLSVRGRCRRAVPGSGFRDSRTCTHRVVDDCGNYYLLRRPDGPDPLSLWELVRLIDCLYTPWLGSGERLPYPERLVLESDQVGAGGVPREQFVRVSSLVYPEIGAFYRERLMRWVAEHLPGARDQIQYAPPLGEAAAHWWSRRP